MALKLGFKPLRDTRTFKLSAYKSPKKPWATPPRRVDYRNGRTAYPPLGNMGHSDCVEAALGHKLIQEAAANRLPFVLKDKAVLADYSAITGFNPKKKSTDNGTFPIAALNWWRQNAVFGQAKILGYGLLTPGDMDEWRFVHWAFCGVYSGYSLPTAVHRLGRRKWAPPAGALTGAWTPWSWGGHMMTSCYVDIDDDEYVFPTWRRLQSTSRDFVANFTSEAYAVITDVAIDKVKKINPAGFDLKALLADIAAL